MISRIFSILLITNFLSLSLLAQNKGDLLFDNSYLHTIKITSSTEYNSGAIGYFDADMEIDGTMLNNVAVREKGNISWGNPQKPLKVDINKNISGLKYDGLKKFNLHNNDADPTMQAENIAYQLDKRAGYAAPRASYAEVFYNDAFIGVYNITEQVDNYFIKHSFASDTGDLYKGSYIISAVVDLKYGNMEAYTDYKANATAANFDTYVNFRNYLKYMATTMIAGDIDSYPYGGHNFYIYKEPKSNLLNFIPWDHNNAFLDQDVNFYPIEDTEIIVDDPTNKAKYELIMCELLTYLTDNAFISNATSHNYNIITSSTHLTTTPTDHSWLTNYISNRTNNFINAMPTGTVCNQASYPYEMGDLVINEFVAWSDSTGVQEPSGGTPDWIELYNNSSSPITLNDHFYLSDDKDFLKKWYFKDEITIPAGAYLTVWTDRDLHQQGIHTNFKLEKNSGDLYISYDDLTVIDHVSYNLQELNQGYARVPNGTGDFVIQSHTFNANNDTGMTSVETMLGEAENIQIYPNPATESVQVMTSSSIENLQVYSSNGQKVMEQKGNNSFVDLANIPSGIYFLHVQTDSQNKVIKLVKR